jgi:hypothetical protein
MHHSLNTAKAFRVEVSLTGSPFFLRGDLKVKLMPRRSKGMAAQRDSGTAQECLDAAAHYEQRGGIGRRPDRKGHVRRCSPVLARTRSMLARATEAARSKRRACTSVTPLESLKK